MTQSLNLRLFVTVFSFAGTAFCKQLETLNMVEILALSAASMLLGAALSGDNNDSDSGEPDNTPLYDYLI